MDLLFEKKYAEYDTYSGDAGRIEIEFTIPNLPMPMSQFITWLSETAVEEVVNQKGATLLLQRIWTEYTFWHFIPMTKYVLEVNLYHPEGVAAGEVKAFIVSLSVIALAIIGVIGLFGIDSILKSSVPVFWGYENNGDPGGRGERQPTPFESIAKTMQWGVIGLCGVGAMLTLPRVMEMYKEYKPPQTVYQIE